MTRQLYCTAQSVADFLNIGITVDDDSDPNTDQIETYIKWAMEELERRTNRAWGDPKSAIEEIKDIKPAWDFSRGIPIYLHHTDVKELDSDEGDKIEVWNGNSYDNIELNNLQYEESPRFGKIWFRGYGWSYIKSDRLRITYRYSSTLTPDVEEMTVKLTALKWLSRSFNLENISFGGSVSPYEVMDRWKKEIDDWVTEVQEWVLIEN